MRQFGDEVVNIGEVPPGVPLMQGQPATGWLTPEVTTDSVLTDNATNLRHVSNYLRDVKKGGMIIIPPGRFYLGVPPREPKRATASESDADIVLAHNIRLHFMPGGMLIPVSLAPNQTGYRRLPWMAANERYKVRLEVQSTIDAEVMPIFDAFVDDPRGDDDRMPEREAGQVFFTRQNVGEVYPEWWGAVSSEGLAEPARAGVVRRTTKAMQACFDAAHRAMLEPFPVEDGSYPGVVVDLIRSSLEDVWRPRPEGFHGMPGRWLLDGRLVVEREPSSTHIAAQFAVIREPLRHLDLDLGQRRRSSSVAPIPVVLHGVYELDDEVTVGFTVAEAAHEGRPSSMRPPSHDVFVLRGARSTAAGAIDCMARLVASGVPGSAFAREQADWGSPLATRANAKLTANGKPAGYARRALLGVRGPVGVTVRDVGFDANYTAARCVTLADFLGGQHGPSFTGCGFRNARTELVHLGGELRNVVAARGGGKAVYAPGNAWPWRSGGDLSGLVFDRCRFETDTAGRLRSAKSRGTLRARNPIGVVFRAGQSYAVAFRACDLVGPANPMILALSGRLSLDGCRFDTSEVVGAVSIARVVEPLGSTNGTDVFLELPLRETQVFPKPMDAPPLVAQTITCVTARSVVSQSAQFLASSADGTTRVTPAQAAVVISSLRHEPRAPTQRPSVFWGGSACRQIPFVMFASTLGIRSGGRGLALGPSGDVDVVLVGVRAGGLVVMPNGFENARLRRLG